jgi:hypothetical protein
MKTRRDEPDPVDQAVARALDQIELEDPPEDLKPNVLRAIGARPEPARMGWFENLRAGISRRLFVQLYPFAAGAAVGAVALALLSGEASRPGAGRGTMAGAMIPSHSGAVRVDDQRFELGRANVRFEVARLGRTAVVTVATETSEEVVVTLQFRPEAARVERLVEVPSSSGGVEYGPGWVRFRQLGRDRAEIALALESGAGDAPIRVGIASREGAIHGALRVRGGGM